ncbi:phosphoglycolate phosphatase 1B, chloroplastic [Aedes aegypti]|nr:phosphoglycolate phosphatase 1B, chloroplastic [Aedes aegypti]
MSASSSSTPSKRLLDLSLEDKKRFLDSFDYVLTDCDGVVWNLYGPIEGVGSAISALKSQDKRVVYVSNNSVRTLQNYRDQVRTLGHEVDDEDVVHPVVSVIKYLKSINFDGLIYAICSQSFLDSLRDAGFEVIHGPNDAQPESLRLIIPVIYDKKPVKAVVVDYDFNCNHTKLLRAELYLKGDPECMLIAGATDRSISVTQQFEVLGSGRYVDVLEQATGRTAMVLGKPGHQLGVQLK